MNIYDYITAGGKNLILEYINNLPKLEKAAAHRIRDRLEIEGEVALQTIKTRQLRGKLWEIKFSDNRIMYVIKDSDSIYFLHACKKQKNKAEKLHLEKAIKRAKEVGLIV